MLLNSTAAMYLRPAMKQAGSRLNVLTNTLVTRVMFDKRQATGIEYSSNGQTKQAFASREVMCCLLILVCHLVSQSVGTNIESPLLTLWRPLLPYWYIKHPVPEWVKWSFAVSECPDVKNYKWQFNPVWHRMLYSYAHMAALGIKGLSILQALQLYISLRFHWCYISHTSCKLQHSVLDTGMYQSNALMKPFVFSCIRPEQMLFQRQTHSKLLEPVWLIFQHSHLCPIPIPQIFDILALALLHNPTNKCIAEVSHCPRVVGIFC